MGSLPLLLLLVLMIGFLFFSFRKQKRQMAKTAAMQNSIEVGDRIMTTTGLYGTVVGIDDDNFELEIAAGVVTTWLRRAVAQVVTEELDAPDLESIPDDETDAIDADDFADDRVDFDKHDKKDD